MNNRKLYVSEEAFLKAANLAEERKTQIVGYKAGDKFYKFSRDTYKTAGIMIVLAGWFLSYGYAPIGIALWGIGLYVYCSGPSGPIKRIYLCDEVKWEKSYTLQNYIDNKCPSCGSSVKMAHKLVTRCSACDLHICKFGSMLETAKG